MSHRGKRPIWAGRSQRGSCSENARLHGASNRPFPCPTGAKGQSGPGVLRLGAPPAQDRTARRQIPASSGSVGVALVLIPAKAKHNQSSHLHSGVELSTLPGSLVPQVRDRGSAPSPECPRDILDFIARGAFSLTGRGKRLFWPKTKM